MQNTVWKLTTLAGVAAIGVLVVLQVQRGLDRQWDGSSAADEHGLQALAETQNATTAGETSVAEGSGTRTTIGDLEDPSETVSRSDTAVFPSGQREPGDASAAGDANPFDSATIASDSGSVGNPFDVAGSETIAGRDDLRESPPAHSGALDFRGDDGPAGAVALSNPPDGMSGRTGVMERPSASDFPSGEEPAGLSASVEPADSTIGVDDATSEANPFTTTGGIADAEPVSTQPAVTSADDGSSFGSSVEEPPFGRELVDSVPEPGVSNGSEVGTDSFAAHEPDGGTMTRRAPAADADQPERGLPLLAQPEIPDNSDEAAGAKPESTEPAIGLRDETAPSPLFPGSATESSDSPSGRRSADDSATADTSADAPPTESTGPRLFAPSGDVRPLSPVDTPAGPTEDWPADESAGTPDHTGIEPVSSASVAGDASSATDNPAPTFPPPDSGIDDVPTPDGFNESEPGDERTAPPFPVDVEPSTTIDEPNPFARTESGSDGSRRRGEDLSPRMTDPSGNAFPPEKPFDASATTGEKSGSESDESPRRVIEREPVGTRGDRTAPDSEAAHGGSPSTADAPRPLAIPEDAARLDPADEDILRGDGTVDPDAPRGAQSPTLTINKLAPKSATIGQPLIYSVVVQNVGQVPAHRVVVEDRIPRGTRLTGTIPRAELIGKRLIWRLGTLPPGAKKTIRIRVIPFAEGEVGSVATVSFEAAVAAATQVTAAKLKLETQAPKKAKLGEPVVLRFKISNVGSAPAEGVVIRDLIPEHLEHPAGRDLEYEVGTLPPGESREVELTLTAAEAGRAVNRTVVTAGGQVAVDAEAALEIVGPTVEIVRSGPTRRFVGRPAVYVNEVKNPSSTVLTGLRVVETLPAGVRFTGATAGGRYDPATRSVHWRIDRLKPQESVQLKVTVIPESPGERVGRIRVLSQQETVAETVSRMKVDAFAVLDIDVTGNDGPLAVGERQTLRIRVRNRGARAERQVVLRVRLPEQASLASVDAPVRYRQDGSLVEFDPVAQLPAGGELVVSLTVAAVQPGDGRVRVEVQGEQTRQPVLVEEPLIAYSDE